jgi:signal transduction histidine kinase
VIFLMLLIGGSLAVRQINEAYVYSRLERDMEALLGRVRVGAEGELRMRERRLSPVYAQPLSGHYFQIVSGDSPPLRSRSLWDETLPLTPLPPGEQRSERLDGPADQVLLVQTGGFIKGGHELTMQVAEDITPLDAQIRGFQALLIGIFLAVFLILLAAQRHIVRKALRRLDAVRDEVRLIGHGEREKLSENVPIEVRPLVQEFNRLLLLMSERIHRSRNALGNLAHALKAPLTLISAELQRGEQPAEQRESALEQTGRIRQLIERELRRARIAGGSLPGQQFDATEDVPALIETVQRLHTRHPLQIEAGELPERTLPVDREDMLELLGNLLDNAGKWARRRVRLSVRAGRRLHVCVEDDGPGVSAEQIDRLTERGARLDESRAGHGMGLAIVRDIVKVYAGELTFDRSPELGGLRVSVELTLEHSVTPD